MNDKMQIIKHHKSQKNNLNPNHTHHNILMIKSFIIDGKLKKIWKNVPYT